MKTKPNGKMSFRKKTALTVGIPLSVVGGSVGVGAAVMKQATSPDTTQLESLISDVRSLVSVVSTKVDRNQQQLTSILTRIREVQTRIAHVASIQNEQYDVITDLEMIVSSLARKTIRSLRRLKTRGVPNHEKIY